MTSITITASDDDYQKKYYKKYFDMFHNFILKNIHYFYLKIIIFKNLHILYLFRKYTYFKKVQLSGEKNLQAILLFLSFKKQAIT